MHQSRTNENYPLFEFLRDMWAFAKGYRFRLVFWLVIRATSTYLGLLIPIILARLVNSLSEDNFTFSSAFPLLVAILVVGLLQVFFRLSSKFNIGALADQIRLKVRQQSISQFLNFDLAWHERENSGKKITVITRGADSAKELIRYLSSTGGGLDILVNIGGVMVYFLFFRLNYFVLALLNVVFYILVNQKINQTLVVKWHSLNKENEKVIGKNYDYFSNIGLIKRLGIGQQINQALFKKELGYTLKAIATNRLNIKKWMSIQSLSQIFGVIAIALVTFDIYNGQVSVGDFFVVSGYLSQLQGSLSDIASTIDEVINGKLALFRLIQLSKSGKTTTDIGTKPSPSHPSILCSNVGFTYHPNPNSILSGLNLTIPFGQKVGLVGESGSGKSTFTKLLLRLYLLNHGYIFLNETDINAIKTDELKRQFAVVPQDTEVFNLSFKENIIIASDNRKFDPKLYLQALEIAECQPILAKINNNHQVMLGEKGVRLSGGERQRLGIARAIYKNSPIMIFDESTSSLDSKTESKILANIDKGLKNKTILWIAHRLSTLRFTDRIVVFHQGKIVEDAAFDSLIRSKGLFYQLWQIQKKTKMTPIAVK